MKDEEPGPRVLSATARPGGTGKPGGDRGASLALTNDPNVNVRNAAAAGLGQMGAQAESAAPAMLQALNDRDGTVRVHVIVALGRIGPAGEAVASSLKTMAEQDPSVNFRIWAIRASA